MPRRASLALFFLLLSCGFASAQDPLGWNSPRALALMDRARARRELPRGDSSLHNYQAKANGFVYFYLDRRETDERTLVKVDQIAIELFWKRPGISKQRIVGMRNVSRLPNRMYYHLDHFTVVQNGFGDVIRVGDGDEVSDVPHPAAPGADLIYDYRLADSVTLQLGGGEPEVRVYEVQVRPKRANRPALLGSVFVDRATADIVRMTFTFTPASYVDKRLDYINLSLDNGLFGGRYWLPSEQSVEIRRQIPELDFAAGAIIRGRLHINQYVFNDSIPDWIFDGPPVVAVSEQARKTYPFPEDIYAGVTAEGLAPPPEMQDLRARAAALLREHRLSGLPPLRLYVPNASSVLRHDHAEGWYGGVGATYAPSPTFHADLTGGYAFGAHAPEATLSFGFRGTDASTTLQAYYNNPRDLGPIPGMPGVINTFTSLGDHDYTNLYFTRGASFDVRTRTPLWAGFFLRGENHRPTLGSRENPNRLDIEGGSAFGGGFEFGKVLTDSGGVRWGGETSLDLQSFNSTDGDKRLFGRALLSAELRAISADKTSSFIGRLDAGANTSRRAPTQYRFLLGGRETVPGYGYRSIEANQYALIRGELSRVIFGPWVRGRLLGNIALTRRAEHFLDGGPDDDGVHGSVGVGVGLLWDVVRVDFMSGTKWQALISIRPDFWDML